MSNFGKKLLLDLIVPFAKDILPKLETKATSVVIVKFERKMEGQEAVRAEKGFILSISKEDLDYILLKWQSHQKWWIIWMKIFSSVPSFKQYKDY